MGSYGVWAYCPMLPGEASTLPVKSEELVKPKAKGKAKAKGKGHPVSPGWMGFCYMDVYRKIGGKTPKMDGENNGNPY